MASTIQDFDSNQRKENVDAGWGYSHFLLARRKVEGFKIRIRKNSQSRTNQINKVILFVVIFTIALVSVAQAPPPATPKLERLRVISPTEVELIWTWVGNPNDLQAFQVHRVSNGVVDTPRQIGNIQKIQQEYIASTATTTFRWIYQDALKANTKYEYRVVAFFEAQHSQASDPISHTPYTTP